MVAKARGGVMQIPRLWKKGEVVQVLRQLGVGGEGGSSMGIWIDGDTTIGAIRAAGGRWRRAEVTTWIS